MKLTAAEAKTLDMFSDFVATVRDRLRDEFDNKSEKWQESDKGQDADAFAQEWEEFADTVEGVNRGE